MSDNKRPPSPNKAMKGEEGLLSWNPQDSKMLNFTDAVLGEDAPEHPLMSWDPEHSRILASFGSAFGRSSTQGTDATHMSDQMPKPGTAIPDHVIGVSRDEPMTLIRKLGNGSFGEVWEARQPRLGRTVAVKMVRLDLAGDKDSEDARHTFVDTNIRQEALTAASLDHPNIVPVYDLRDDSRGFPALAMKLVRGRSWDEVIKAEYSVLTTDEYLTRHIPILISVSQAVAFAHSRGVVHRDLKPSQVMIGDFGEVLLMDWGLGVVFDPAALEAAVQSPPSEVMATLQSASCPAGTLSYMAPEQTDPTAARIGPWTDVYLLGGILYHLLSGELPHGNGSSSDLYPRAKAGIIVPLEEAAAGRDMPMELIELCYEALAVLPEDRPQNGRVFLDRLVAYLYGAGRRTQSRALTAQAQDMLTAARGDYSVLTRCDEMLQRARDLWAENHMCIRLAQRVHDEFAESALRRGDLQLAKVHAERLADTDRRASLHARIATAEALLKRREQERRIGTMATMVALVVIVVGSLYYNRRISDTVKETSKAQAQGELLISSLQATLYPELEAVGQMKLLSTLGTEVDDYYTNVGRLAQSAQTRLSHVNAVLALRRVQSRLGDTTASVALAERAESMAINLQKAYPNQPELRSVLASARAGLAEQLYLSGNDLPRATAVAHQAEKDLTLLKSVKFTNPEQMAVAASAAEDLSSLLFMFEGDARSSKSLLDGAAELRTAALAQNPTSIKLIDRMAWHHLRVGQYQVACGELESALASFGKAAKFRDQIESITTDNFANRREIGRLMFWTGRAHERMDQAEEAEKFHRAALIIREKMADYDPDDITLRWNLAVSRAKVAELQLNSGTNGNAEEELSATLVILSQIPAGTLGNREFSGAKAATLLVHGRMLKKKQDERGAIRNWEEAAAILQSLEKSAPYETFNLRALAEVLLYLDRVKEADVVAEKLRTLGYKAGILSRMLVEKGLRPL